MIHMLTAKQKMAIGKICYDYYKKLNPTHNVWHLKNTVKIAVYIAKKEKAGAEICKYGAMLHQFHDAKRVDSILTKLKVDGETRKQLVHCVYCASPKTINKASTKEAKIVNDADKLQVLGVIGIVRQIHDFMMYRKLSLRDAFKRGLKEQKLFYTQMKTATARRMAKEHYDFGIKFYKYAMRVIK